MRNRLIIWISLFLVFAINSCEKENNDGNNITKLSISLSKSKILDDNADKVSITVLDQLMKDITNQVTLYIDDTVLNSPEFTSSIPGKFNIYAEYKGLYSDTLIIDVVEDEGFSYTKNILIEQFTGTWCGYCPRAIYQIDQLTAVDSEISHVAYHLNDPFSYSYNSSLFQYFGFTGVPTVFADRDVVWTGSVGDITRLHKPVRAGISLSVSGTKEELLVNAKVTFGKIFDSPVSLSVYVIHDGLIYDQVNYYNDDPSSPWYSAGATITGFEHKSIMVKTATDMYGDIIPVDQIDIGAIYEKDYSIKNFTCEDINQIKVVAFVHYTEDLSYLLINSLTCAFGESSSSSLESK